MAKKADVAKEVKAKIKEDEKAEKKNEVKGPRQKPVIFTEPHQPFHDAYLRIKKSG